MPPSTTTTSAFASTASDVDSTDTHDAAPRSLLTAALTDDHRVHSAAENLLAALRQIETPVPDLASTLTLSTAEDDANEANVSFLRTQLDDPSDDWHPRHDRAAAGGSSTSQRRPRGAQSMLSLERDRQLLHQQQHQAQQQAQQQHNARMESLSEDRARRGRLQRVLARLNRIHDPAYGNRVPSHNSVYDWSPAAELEDDDVLLQDYIAELQRQQPNTHPDILRVLAQTRLDGERERRRRASLLTDESSTESLRERPSEAIAAIRAMRREEEQQQQLPRNLRSAHHRPAPPADNSALVRMMAQRRLSLSGARRYLPNSTSSNDPAEAYFREYMDSHGISSTESRTRRSGLGDRTEPAASSLSWLQQSIEYLANLRKSNSYEDSLGYLVDAGFRAKGFFDTKDEDFLFDLNTLPPIAETSLLAPGTVFSGFQCALTEHNITQASASTRSSSARSRYPIQVYPTQGNRESHSSRNYDSSSVSWQLPRSDVLPPLESMYPRQDWEHTTQSLHNNPDHDAANSWPVKVQIHSIDYSNMTISATMEAYGVPSPAQQLNPNLAIPLHPPTRSSTSSHPRTTVAGSFPSTSAATSTISTGNPPKSITTYLEGEILNFTHTTLHTENFATAPTDDATYWRKLEPFRHMDDQQLASKLLSREFLTELSSRYVLMRWKERCFVEAREAPECELADGCGLTISGFYYVCLRRGDGAVEGLYCDANSNPYQQLRLRREGRSGFTAWGFK